MKFISLRGRVTEGPAPLVTTAGDFYAELPTLPEWALGMIGGGLPSPCIHNSSPKQCPANSCSTDGNACPANCLSDCGSNCPVNGTGLCPGDGAN